MQTIKQSNNQTIKQSNIFITNTSLPQSLLNAYEETHYRVCHEPSFILRVGIHSEAVALLQQEYGVKSCAFVTACNPFSQPLSNVENQRRQKNLEKIIATVGWVAIKGVGQHPSNNWQGEPSFLIMGISIEKAMTLARRFDQNALVFLDEKAIPELVLLK